VEEPGYPADASVHSYDGDRILDIVRFVQVRDISKGPNPNHHPFLLLSEEEVLENPNVRESLLQGVLERTPSKSLVSRQRTLSIDETREYLQQGLPLSRNIGEYTSGDYTSIVRGRSASVGNLEMVKEEDEEEETPQQPSEPLEAGGVTFRPYVPKLGYAAVLKGQGSPTPSEGESTEQPQPSANKKKNKKRNKKKAAAEQEGEGEKTEEATSSQQQQEQKEGEEKVSTEQVSSSGTTESSENKQQEPKEPVTFTPTAPTSSMSFADILKNKA
jgi:hypothetical protein